MKELQLEVAVAQMSMLKKKKKKKFVPATWSLIFAEIFKCLKRTAPLLDFGILKSSSGVTKSDHTVMNQRICSGDATTHVSFSHLREVRKSVYDDWVPLHLL